MNSPIRAVTFDYWDTLVHEPPEELRERRVRIWAGLLGKAGIPVDPDGLRRALDASWDRYVDAWQANRQYRYPEAVDDALAFVGLDPSPALRDALAAAFRDPGIDGADLHLAEGLHEVLADLRERGVRIGIVCDVGMTPSPVLRSVLERHGVLGHFDHWSFSDEVGCYKPAAEIFQHALAGLGAPPPDRVVHVGDRRRTDVAGALGMGMTAVRFARWFDDAGPGPEAHHVLVRHADLPAALGIA